MAYSIESIKSVLYPRGGIAERSKYRVILPSINTAPTARAQDLDVLCQSVQLPGRVLLTHDRRVGAEFTKVAYGDMVGDVSMSFIETGRYDLRRYFEAWQNLVFNQETKEAGWLRGTAGDEGYGKTVYIYQLSRDLETTIYKCELLNAWPLSIGPYDFNAGETSPNLLDVQLSYTNWKQHI